MTTQHQSPKSTILIVGAGIAGPTLSLTILQNPLLSTLYTPVLFDRTPEPSKNTYGAAGAGVVLASNALYPLSQLGILDEFKAISQEVETVHLWRDYNTSSEQPVVDLSGKHVNQMRLPGWKREFDTALRAVERGRLQSLLVEKVLAAGGEVVWGKKVCKVLQHQTGDRVEIVFEDGDTRKGDLVVGADGTWSAVRRCIAGDAETWKPEFQGASVLYGISKRPADCVEDEKIIGQTHWTTLHNGGGSTWGLPDGKQFWTLHMLEHAPPTSPQATIQGESKYQAVISTGGYSLQSTEHVLKRFENVWHPLAGSYGNIFRDSERIVRSALWQKVWDQEEIANSGKEANMVLIGDAARVMIPTSGQGACMSIEDATVFANALLNNPPTQKNFSAALNEYTSLRIPRSKAIAKQSYWSAVVSMGEWWWWRWIRDLMTKWLPMGADARETTQRTGKEPKDLMAWLHDAHFQVKLREAKDGVEPS